MDFYYSLLYLMYYGIKTVKADIIIFQDNFTDLQLEGDLVIIYEDTEYPDPIPIIGQDETLMKSNCTFPTIHEFPSDIFSQEERQNGFVIFHLIITFYVFYAFAIVCGDYFVPSVERLSAQLHMESDIAGATLMGMATSSPELFTNVVGTFIMKGDIGVGTIIGSAVFNHLAISACVGFTTKKMLHLDWWPVTRDVIFYTISVLALFIILYDERIYWYEASSLLLIYVIYLYGMYHDERLQLWVEDTFGIHKNACFLPNRSRRVFSIFSKSEEGKNENNMSSSQATIITMTPPIFSLDEKNKKAVRACELPEGRRSYIWVDWFCSWPIRALLSLTIPDCRKCHLKKLYPLTFIMSTLWIALLSYLVSWMMTVVGYTLLIPDTVFGISVIAAGTSLPEALSSVIVARKGLGTMALGNAVGSNTFNILVCLGLPWLIRSWLNRNLANNYAQIGSFALEYSIAVLILSILMIYFILMCNGFCIDRKVAFSALCLYICFLTFDSLVELNVIVDVNLPVCNL